MTPPRFIVALSIALSLATAGPVAAHPLGNFSISQYSAISIERNEIELRYLIEMAEIPTFQEIQETGLVPKVGDASAEAYVARKAATLREGLWLEVNGRRIALEPQSHEIIFPAGAGGLPTLKLGVLYKGKLAGDASARTPYSLYYRDGNFSGRVGWKEIIAVAAKGAELLNSSVSEVDRSARLSSYPTDLLNSPPQVLEARVTFAPGESPVSSPGAIASSLPRHDSEPIRQARSPAIEAVSDGKDATATPNAYEPIRLQPNKQPMPKNSFTELIAAKELNWSMILFAFAIAAALGALHALEPGHGKTLVAAYLVGSRGTMKHALTLGLIVTAAHTAGVYLLGGATLYASRYVVPEQLYPWLALSSGVMIMGLGLALFLRRYRNKDDHVHQDHDHRHHRDHGPGHDHHHHGPGGHSHHHHPEPAQDASLKQLFALGISGGIIPCPAALVVLLSAVSMQRVGFGLLLIVAFSVGLAAVLIAIGLLMVYARRFMARFHGDGRLTARWLPLTSSAFIVLFGAALTWQALQSAGFLRIAL